MSPASIGKDNSCLLRSPSQTFFSLIFLLKSVNMMTMDCGIPRSSLLHFPECHLLRTVLLTLSSRSQCMGRLHLSLVFPRMPSLALTRSVTKTIPARCRRYLLIHSSSVSSMRTSLLSLKYLRWRSRGCRVYFLCLS